MKLLLTSAGVSNPSIHAALVDLLGKPVEESTALAVPTAGYGHPMTSPVRSAPPPLAPYPLDALLSNV